MVGEEEALFAQLQAVMMDRLEEAARSGHFMIAVWHLNGSDVRYWRKSGDFMVEDFDAAMDLLETDLKNERQRLEDLQQGI